jgi:hypothetical protein
MGVLGAAMIVGETAGVTRFTSKDAFARFNGTAPMPVWSGNNVCVRLSRGGNRRINTALHMAAVTYDTRGLDRHISWEADQDYWFEVIVDGDITTTLHVDGVALNARTTDSPGGSIVLSSVEGSVQFTELELARLR